MIHISYFSVQVLKSRREEHLSVLSALELERLNRFHFEKDREQFLVAHGCLRGLLGRELSLEPAEILFEKNLYGKPAVQNKEGNGLSFSLSHSYDWVAVAWSWEQKVGIDLEKVDPERDIESIAKLYFHPEEVKSLAAQQIDEQKKALFQYWTFKEAILKGIGKGLSFPLDAFQVKLQTGEGGTVLFSDSVSEGDWFVRSISPPSADYVAALASDHEIEMKISVSV